MHIFLFGLLFVLPTVVWAGQAEDIAIRAGSCWSIPSGLDTPPSASFDVVFDVNGNVTDATVIEYTPSGEQGRQVAQSAINALQACSPYKGVTGTVRVLMDPKAVFANQTPINPFK